MCEEILMLEPGLQARLCIYYVCLMPHLFHLDQYMNEESPNFVVSWFRITYHFCISKL